MPVFFFYISFVPVVLGIALGGLVVYWDHRRDLALIEKGLYQPMSRSQSFLAWGWSWWVSAWASLVAPSGWECQR